MSSEAFILCHQKSLIPMNLECFQEPGHPAIFGNKQETDASTMKSEHERLVIQLKTMAEEKQVLQHAADTHQEEVSSLQQNLQATTERLRSHQAQQHRAQQSQSKIEAELDTQRTDKAALMDHLAHLQSIHRHETQEHEQQRLQHVRQCALDDQLAASRGQHAADEARQASSDQQLHAQAELLKELQVKLRTQQDHANELQLEKASAEERLMQLIQELDMLKAEQHASDLNRQAIDEQYQKLRGRCSELEEEAQHLDQLKARLALATESEDAAHSTLTHLEQEREALSSQLQEVHLTNESLVEELSTASGQQKIELQQLDSRNADLRKQLHELQHQDVAMKSHAEIQVQQLEQQLKQSKAENAALNSQHENLLQKHAERQDQTAIASQHHEDRLRLLQEEQNINHSRLHSMETELAAARNGLQQWKLACNEQDQMSADQQKQADKQKALQAASDSNILELTEQLQQAAAYSDELLAKLQASWDEQAQLSADLKEASEACTSLRHQLDETTGQVVSERAHSSAVEEEALEASRRCAALQTDIHGLREAKLEGEYASASHIHTLEQEVQRLEADLRTAQEAGSGLLASQQQLQAELEKAAKWKQHAEDQQSQTLHLQEQIRIDSNKAVELRKQMHTEYSRSDHLQQQLEAECCRSEQVQEQLNAEQSRSQKLQEQLEAAQSEATRLSAALDSIQAASLASQHRRAIPLHGEDTDTGASTPSSEERRVMQVAQISEMSLKLHEAEVLNLQHQIELQQNEISALQRALEDQADRLQGEQQTAQSRVLALQKDLDAQARLVQQHQQASSRAQEAFRQLEAQHQADVGRLQQNLTSLRQEAKSRHAESMAMKGDEEAARHALEDAVMELQSQLETAERDMASLQRERNSLLHQLAASKRDEGRLERLQQQCAALETENAALSDCLACQVSLASVDNLCRVRAVPHAAWSIEHFKCVHQDGR